VQRLSPDGGAVQRREGGPAAAPAPAAAGGIDTASYERWLQSGLNAVLHASLAVDGVLGPATSRTVRTFQGRAQELVGTRLAVDGVAGAQTKDALATATATPAPTIRERQRRREAAADAETSGPQAAPGAPPEPGSAPGAAPAEAPTTEAEPTSSPELTAEERGQEAQTQTELRGALGGAATEARSNGAEPDVDAAYEETRRWTEERRSLLDTSRAVSVHRKLVAEYQAAHPDRPDAAAMDRFIAQRWFKAYWMLKCYQFAAAVQQRLQPGRHPSLMKLVAQTKAAAAGGDASLVRGRTAVYRGRTLAELGAAELARPVLQAGAAIHVKLHFEGDNPYEFKDDFHHWVVYAGGGKFSDSLTGQNKSGAAMDQTLRGWVRSAFKNPDYRFMHDDPRFASGKDSRGRPIVVPNLQPRVSAEYDPTQATTRREG
jgi:hypothetical protein